jgi:hypothetical protein
MNRRDVLKTTAAVLAAPVVAMLPASGHAVGEFRFIDSKIDPKRSHGYQWDGQRWNLSCPCLDQGLPYCGGWINTKVK